MIGLNEFIDFYAETNATSKVEARKNIETFIDTYKRATYEKGGVTIRTFMKSSVVNVPEKEGINPRTKEKIVTRAKTIVKVKALESFKNMEA